MANLTHDTVVKKFGDKILSATDNFGELAFVVDRSTLVSLVLFLRDDSSLRYLHLSDITATDWPDRAKRFEVIYHLYSFDLKEYVRIKLHVAEKETVPTLSTEWDTANWLEREVFDLFGVVFEGHPDLRRILLWDEFEGHPLRKDYPLTYEVPQFTYNQDQPPEVIK
jgi:NADH-quinone oxidoreductase subunit C